MAKGISVALLCLALAGSAVARDLLATDCSSTQVYRYIAMQQYPAGVKVDDAYAAEMAMLKACGGTMVRGVIGKDLGLHDQLLGPDYPANFDLVKILDFESQAKVQAYYACKKAQKNPLLTAYSTAAKSIIPVSSCASAAIKASSYMHVLVYAMRDGYTPTDMAKVDANIDLLIGSVDCVVFNYANGFDMGWGTALGDGDVYYEYSGDIEFPTANGLHAYWGYALGPPKSTYIANVDLLVQNPHRLQIQATIVK